jgi:hypothetical protein
LIMLRHNTRGRVTWIYAMSRSLVLLALLIVAMASDIKPSQSRVPVVTPGPDATARITLPNGHVIRVPREPGQVGISDPQTASDHSTVGWLVEYSIDGLNYPISGTLVAWRDGQVRRRFGTAQAFYSWAFYSRGTQVAFHTGPTHGEQTSHCELHDIKTGRAVAKWDGDLQSSNKPDWVAGLSH